LRPDSVIEYLSLNNNPDKSSTEVLTSLDSIAFPVDETSRLNVLGVLDGLTGDLAIITEYLLKALNTTTPQRVPTSVFMRWDMTDDQRTFTNASRLDYMISHNANSWWFDTFLNSANRTIINCFIAVRDAIQ
jgi:hypothetical protein